MCNAESKLFSVAGWQMFCLAGDRDDVVQFCCFRSVSSWGVFDSSEAPDKGGWNLASVVLLLSHTQKQMLTFRCCFSTPKVSHIPHSSGFSCCLLLVPCHWKGLGEVQSWALPVTQDTGQGWALQVLSYSCGKGRVGVLPSPRGWQEGSTALQSPGTPGAPGRVREETATCQSSSAQLWVLSGTGYSLPQGLCCVAVGGWGIGMELETPQALLMLPCLFCFAHCCVFPGMYSGSSTNHNGPSPAVLPPPHDIPSRHLPLDSALSSPHQHQSPLESARDGYVCDVKHAGPVSGMIMDDKLFILLYMDAVQKKTLAQTKQFCLF